MPLSFQQQRMQVTFRMSFEIDQQFRRQLWFCFLLCQSQEVFKLRIMKTNCNGMAKLLLGRKAIKPWNFQSMDLEIPNRNMFADQLNLVSNRLSMLRLRLQTNCYLKILILNEVIILFFLYFLSFVSACLSLKFKKCKSKYDIHFSLTYFQLICIIGVLQTAYKDIERVSSINHTNYVTFFLSFGHLNADN